MTADAPTDAQIAKIIASLGPPEERPVSAWMVRRHQRTGHPDAVRITYSAGQMTYPEWILPEHEGPGRYRAEKWWAAHGGQLPVPETVTEALERWAEVTCPAAIVTRKNGKWHDIVGRVMPQPDSAAA